MTSPRAAWATVTVTAYGRRETRHVAEITCLWYGSWHTVPFALLVDTLIIIWYARYGHDPADVDDRRAAQPWYRTKTEPAFEDMLIKLRRTIIAARFSPSRPGQPALEQIRAVLAAWEAAAA